MILHRGGCHCGRVLFHVEGEISGVEECNCSICSRRGYLHWIVPRDRFHLAQGEDALTPYTFGTGTAKHLFCATCGICSFYVPRSDPEKISVNVRCLEGVDLDRLEIERFDGRNWECAYAERRGGGGD